MKGWARHCCSAQLYDVLSCDLRVSSGSISGAAYGIWRTPGVVGLAGQWLLQPDSVVCSLAQITKNCDAETKSSFSLLIKTCATKKGRPEVPHGGGGGGREGDGRRVTQ